MLSVLETPSFRSKLLLVGSLLSAVCLALAPGAARAETPPPTVAITGPTEGSMVKGVVTIDATARAGAGDHIGSISFYDGVNHIGDYYCENQESCTASVHWEATGLSGPHSLTARADTEAGLSTTSAPVTVTVVSPPPTVSITAPANGATVKGTVTVSASAATDPSQVDYPTEISFYDGVNDIGHIDCQGQQTCQGAVSWPATGLSGAHTLTARVNTNDSLTVTSAPVTVNVVSPPPTVRITRPGSGAALGGTLTVSVVGSTDPSQMDYPTGMTVFDGTSEIGSINCQGQQSCAGSLSWNTKGLTGQHALTAVIHTNTGRTATSPRVIVGGSPQRRRRALPAAGASCHLASLAVPLRHRDRGLCTIRGAPTGTRVAIQYRNRAGGWTTVVRGHVARGGRFHFSLHGVRRSSYTLAILIYASRASAAARVPFGTLHIG
jgi:hypothetical protein